MTWNEAIDSAMAIGLVVPNHFIMNKILRFLQGQEDILGYQILPHQFITSTTYVWNTRKFVLPVEKDIFELQHSDSVENSSKSIKRKAYAVSPDMTETDIDTFNFYFEDATSPIFNHNLKTIRQQSK